MILYLYQNNYVNINLPCFMKKCLIIQLAQFKKCIYRLNGTDSSIFKIMV